MSLPERLRPGSAESDPWLEAVIIAAATVLIGFALREFIAPDYRAEQVAAFNAFASDGFGGFMEHLPGYPGAMFVELLVGGPVALAGASDALIWRAVSAAAVGTLALALVAALPAIRASEASRSAARLGLALAAASPAAYWALRIGHPEEVLSTGLLLGAVLAAARERPILAGVLLGLSIGKAWPLAVALPVLGLLLPDTRRVAIGAIATLIAAAAIFLPPMFFAPDSIEVLANTGTAQIFNTGQLFWWFGTPIDLATVAAQDVPQPRIGAQWAGELSHPLIIGVGTAIGLIWCWTLQQRLLSAPAVTLAALRDRAKSRSREQSAALASSALLVMAGILMMRCYLDTWNVPYYILPALVCGAMGELLAGRRPLITLVATGLMWRFHAPGDLTIRSTPDVYTALYLGWAIPVSIAYVTLGLRAIRDLGRRPHAEPEPAPAPQPVASAR